MAYDLDHLSPFVRQYLETALWSSTDDNDEPLDGTRDVSDFAPSAVQSAIADCEAFQADHADDLTQAGDDEQNGHDFWLTRNGHGAGFWDRGYGDVGRRLTDAAHVYGRVNLYVGDDDLVYGD